MRTRVPYRLAGLAAGALMLAAVASVNGNPARQEAGPVGKLAFAPRLGSEITHGAGRSCSCSADDHGQPRECACQPRDSAREALMPWEGVKAQNLGTGPTQFMVVYFGSSPSSDCTACTLRAVTCSPPVAPGVTWTSSPYVGQEAAASASGATAAVVYSLSPAPAADQGAEWSDWLASVGLPTHTTMAELACRYMTSGHYQVPPPDGAMPVARDAGPDRCQWYSVLHAALMDAFGLLPDTDLPVEPVRGQPMAVIVSSATSGAAGGQPLLDRYDAVTYDEIDRPGPWSYVAPGGSGLTAEGGDSFLSIQNPGSTCLNGAVRPHRARYGPMGDPLEVRVPPGARIEVDVGETWPELNQGAALVLTAYGPAAATMTNQTPTTVSTSRAQRQRSVAARWLMPLAWQEQTGQAPGAGAEGWQTNVALYNSALDPASATFRFQAAGEPARPPIDLPVEALSQVVVQPGFGLGLAGGPGWVEVATGEAPMTAAFESLRSTHGSPGILAEAWSSPAWPVDDARPPAAVGLPDLGGPALGADADAVIRPGATVTGALTTRLAIQNPLTAAARVAIDSFAGHCGYVGTIERTIDPRQVVVVDAADLPWAAFGADSAVVRVLAGQAAAMAVTTRTTWPAALDDGRLPPDLATAYLGVGTDAALGPPVAITATLSVEPDAIELRRPMAPRPLADVAIADASATGRCLAVRAVSDVDWLRVEDALIAVPGVLRLTVEPERLSSRSRQVGTVTLAGVQPGVQPGRLVVTVTVSDVANMRLFLPSTDRRTHR